MKLERLFIALLIIALIVAIPLTFALKHRSKLLKFERNENNSLKLKIDKKQDELKRQQQDNEQLKKQIEDQQKQLEAKRKQQAELVAQEQQNKRAQQAPVALPAGCEQYRGTVAQYDWNVSIALAVMQAESGCRNNVLSPTCDRGLMQVNCVHSAKVNGNLDSLFDPVTNINVAYAIYAGAGWSAWSAYKNGAYLQYL